jgi:hypothetical protein
MRRKNYGLMAVATALCLGGCGTTGAPTIGDEALATIGTSQQAIAVMTLEIQSGGLCQNTTLQLAKKTATGFVPSSHIGIHTPYAALKVEYNEISQVVLPPGEHHIVSYTCWTGDNKSSSTTTVGKKQGTDFFGNGGAYVKSLARFELAAGEVVNIGRLKLNLTPTKGIFGIAMAGPVGVQIQVADQPEAVLAQLNKTKPKLFAQMKTRLMTVSDSPPPPTAAPTAPAATKPTAPAPKKSS